MSFLSAAYAMTAWQIFLHVVLPNVDSPTLIRVIGLAILVVWMIFIVPLGNALKAPKEKVQKCTQCDTMVTLYSKETPIA